MFYYLINSLFNRQHKVLSRAQSIAGKCFELKVGDFCSTGMDLVKHFLFKQLVLHRNMCCSSMQKSRQILTSENSDWAMERVSYKDDYLQCESLK
uniref:Uncharacterized protein n=1 Tax=Melopsittacus undulatus TaxID=13146 RepID=A0A8V5GZ97_MELUD